MAGKQTETVVKAIVAPRRTLQVGVESAGPGAEVELPESEVKRLRALGFLIDPAVEPVPVGNGPSFTPQDGPKVSQPVQDEAAAPTGDPADA